MDANAVDYRVRAEQLFAALRDLVRALTPHDVEISPTERPDGVRTPTRDEIATARRLLRAISDSTPGWKF